MMPRMHSAATHGTPSTPTAPPGARPAGTARRARLLAVSFDLLLYAGAQAVLLALALLVFVLQTGGGERDLTAREATTGWAIALAAAPAWLGLLGHTSTVLGGTPGQRGAHLALEGGPVRRLVRIALHPLGAIGWGWLALVAWLAAIPGVPLLFASAAVLALIGGAASAVIVLRDPSSLPLHDRIAGTRLVAR